MPESFPDDSYSWEAWSKEHPHLDWDYQLNRLVDAPQPSR